MACQEICPLNKGRLKTEPAGVDFAAEETEAFLEAGRRGAWNALPLGAEASARAKFEGLGLTEGIAVFGRNLGLVLKKREERGQEGPSE
jgi:hypothetical protein